LLISNTVFFSLISSQIDYRFGRGSIRRFKHIMFHGVRFNVTRINCIRDELPAAGGNFLLCGAEIHKN